MSSTIGWLRALVHNGRAWSRRWAAFACIVLVAPHPSPAAASESFALSNWTVSDGLPGNYVSAVAQDRLGFLWLATLSGLVRFDGQRFDVLNERNPGIRSSSFSAVEARRDGGVLAGTLEGYLVAVAADGTVQDLGRAFDNNWITSIVEAEDGSILVVGAFPEPASGMPPLARYRDGSYEPLSTADFEPLLTEKRDGRVPSAPGSLLPTHLPSPNLRLDRDASGVIWVSAVFFGKRPFSSPGPLLRSPSAVALLGDLGLAAEAADVAGYVVVRTEEASWRIPAAMDDPVAAWEVDGNARLWVSRRNAVEVYRPQDSTPLQRWEIESRVHDVLLDRDGNVWVAGRTSGLFRLSPSQATQLTPDDGVPYPIHLQVPADRQLLLEPDASRLGPGGSPCADLFLLAPGPSMTAEPACDAAVEDGTGARWQRGRRNRPEVLRDGQPLELDFSPRWIAADSDHADTVWAGDWDGLVRLAGNKDGPVLLDRWSVNAQGGMVPSADGTRWFPGEDGLLRYRNEDGLVRLTMQDGLPVNRVRAALPAADGGLWLGTYGGGLVHYDGQRFRAITTAQGLPEDLVSSVLRDRFGALWLSGNRGIHRVLEHEALRYLAGDALFVPATSVDSRDGLEAPETTGFRSAAAVGDRIYFATFGGVVAVDPAVAARREERTVRPIVLASEGTGAAEGAITLRLLAESRSASLAYTAIHLAAPDDLWFRHRIAALDAGWRVTRERQLSYAGLPPGAFTLELEARHSGGPWTPLRSTVLIDAEAFFWETSWFRIGMLLALALSIAAAWYATLAKSRRRAIELDALVRQRTQELARERDRVREQARELQQLAEGRARFLSGISHELRTPLTLIKGPLDAMRERLRTLLSTADGELLDIAERNVNWMQGLVERLLTAGHSDATHPPLSVSCNDLVAFVRDTGSQLRAAFDASECELVLELPGEPVDAWFDAVLMRSALVNLLLNPLRHCGPGTRVRCRLRRGDGPSAPHRLEVADDGPGIAAEDQPNVFELFYRASGSNRTSEGYGLGLWMVRRIIDRHRGSISLTSSSTGTAFVIELPVGHDCFGEDELTGGIARAGMLVASGPAAAPDPETAFRWPAADRDAGDRPRLLLVDDHRDILTLLKRFLGHRFEVLTASDGRDALRQIDREVPDLVICDVMMPGMDGLTFCKRLRENPRSSFVPLIFLTALSAPDHRIRGVEHGADAYLSKPFDPRELVATIDSIFATRERLSRHLQGLAAAASAPQGPAATASALGTGFAEADDEVARAMLSASGEMHREFLCKAYGVAMAAIDDADFSVDLFAARTHFSRATLYRKMQQARGQSPSEFLRELRLRHAARLLRIDDSAVSEIAYACGFRSVANFSNAFRRHFSTSPSGYREKNEHENVSQGIE